MAHLAAGRPLFHDLRRVSGADGLVADLLANLLSLDALDRGFPDGRFFSAVVADPCARRKLGRPSGRRTGGGCSADRASGGRGADDRLVRLFLSL